MMSSEDGFVMIVVMVMLVIVLALGAAGLAESLDSKTLTTRDTRERRAQQAADAGVQRVLYQQAEANIDNWNLNGGPVGLSTVLDCVVPSLNASLQITGLATVAAGAAGVCPLTSAAGSSTYVEPLGNHAFESSEFIPGPTNLLSGTSILGQNGSAQRQFNAKIVALGFDDNGTNQVYSREEVILAPISPLQAIEGMGNVTIHGLTVLGLPVAAVLNGNVVSRGTLTTPSIFAGLNLSNGLVATLAAPSFSGGLSIANAQTVSASQIIARPTVTINSAKADCPSGGCPAGYTAATHTFSMSSGTVTFQPGDYVFCNFSATGGILKANPTSSAPVRIFIDSPTSSRCAGNAYAKSGGVWNGGNFRADLGISNLLSGTVAPSGVQIYVVGDTAYDNGNTVTIGRSTGALNQVTQAMVVYAPTSTVTMNTGCIAGLACTGVFQGALVGDNVDVTASTITEDVDLGNYPLYDGIAVFRPIQFIQCNSTITSLTGNSTTDTAGC
jgi:Tfp pilus assembly protein PilX